MLTRDQIFAIDDLPSEEVPIPEWGGSVWVRVLTGSERDELDRMLSAGTHTRAGLVALCAVDQDGKRLFTAKDVEKLSSKAGTALEKIMAAALRFNRLTSDSIDEAKN